MSYEHKDVFVIVLGSVKVDTVFDEAKHVTRASPSPSLPPPPPPPQWWSRWRHTPACTHQSSRTCCSMHNLHICFYIGKIKSFVQIEWRISLRLLNKLMDVLLFGTKWQNRFGKFSNFFSNLPILSNKLSISYVFWSVLWVCLASPYPPSLPCVLLWCWCGRPCSGLHALSPGPD